MTQTPTLSTVSNRQHKADILAAVLGYVAARTSEVPYCFLQYEIADQFGVGEDVITLEVMHALSALGWAGAVEINTKLHGVYYFGADTTIRASGAICGYTNFDRRPGPDDEEEAA
ncbi:hypothetical protein SAMN05880590_11018 [Rhizobium sp. RU35A]|uniref:hypothetical protein n=1 Tax=Rhizobium sp. RU35A TaxID=1907414 RepID=UPI000954B8D5|nr:hypothetical protein [Rhizobium sp. RU35A]SIQ99060.1 hypothetical protein SAMN05880590_11018 [Rhizobium sp. RU35A]